MFVNTCTTIFFSLVCSSLIWTLYFCVCVSVYVYEENDCDLCVVFFVLLLLVMLDKNMISLSTLATNATGQLNVLGHNGDTLGVNGAQVGVLKQTDQVGLRGFL